MPNPTNGTPDKLEKPEELYRDITEQLPQDFIEAQRVLNQQFNLKQPGIVTRTFTTYAACEDPIGE